MPITKHSSFRQSGIWKNNLRLSAAVLALAFAVSAQEAPQQSQPLPYNNPGLVVDAGVGLWPHPMPMDYDGDGDPDLLVSTVDVPHNGLYFFENIGGENGETHFAPPERLTDGMGNVTISYLDGEPLVMSPGASYPDFRNSLFEKPEKIAYEPAFYPERKRANQWKRFDYDGDGARDLIIGLGDWSNYGWDNAYDSAGRWTNGDLRGPVYIMRNQGSNEAPDYAEATLLMAGDAPAETYGAPSPNFGDFDDDGDADLIGGSFLDRLTYYENVGSRTQPCYAPGRFLTHAGDPIQMDLQMLQVVAYDWNGDGHLDLIVGEEDGRIAWLEHTGGVENGMPAFKLPRFFQQQAHDVKIGALCTPVGVDWDADGDEDIVAGNTAGYICFLENRGGDVATPKWAAPVYLEADGETIRIQAGYNGSIQGPAEAKWGYTTLGVADWDHDGLLDIVINSIWGKVVWFKNVGSEGKPRLAAAQPVRVAWEGAPPKPAWNWWDPGPGTLAIQWRTTPCVRDLNGDGLNDLIMLDHEGYLAFFERTRREGDLVLLPGQRIFEDAEGQPLRLNDGEAGKSGRRKFTLVDWDGDGKLDLLLNSESVDFYRNVAEAPDEYRFVNQGRIDSRRLAGHTTSPTTVDWNRDGIPDLLIGAEDGFLYYLDNPRE